MIKIETRDSQVPKGKLASSQKKLLPRIKELQSLLSSRSYAHDACSILLPDEPLFQFQSQSLARKLSRPSLLIVIGIGGSNLGAMAVADAVLGKHHNLANPRTALLFADTCEPDLLHSLSNIARHVSDSGGRVMLNLVSKSGGTAESIANFSYLHSMLSYPEVVVTTGEGSPLHSLAEKEGFHVLPIPGRLGGRYSVFSNAGLFPLSVLGIDTQALLSGAKKMRDMCLSPHHNNPASLLASLIFLRHKSGSGIFEQFLFSPDLESAGKWYRQLLAESSGKEWDAPHRRKINSGITPAVAIGSTDLHSMAQLYLAGPNDKLFRFVRVQHEGSAASLPHSQSLDKLVPGLSGKSPSKIMGALFSATQAAFRKRSRPFITLTLKDKSPATMGSLLQLEMLETIYLCHLLLANPFDQPAVEGYKRETRRLLSRR